MKEFGDIEKVVLIQKKNVQALVEMESCAMAEKFKGGVGGMNLRLEARLKMKVQFTTKKFLIVNKNSECEFDLRKKNLSCQSKSTNDKGLDAWVDEKKEFAGCSGGKSTLDGGLVDFNHFLSKSMTAQDIGCIGNSDGKFPSLKKSLAVEGGRTDLSVQQNFLSLSTGPGMRVTGQMSLSPNSQVNQESEEIKKSQNCEFQTPVKARDSDQKAYQGNSQFEFSHENVKFNNLIDRLKTEPKNPRNFNFEDSLGGQIQFLSNNHPSHTNQQQSHGQYNQQQPPLIINCQNFHNNNLNLSLSMSHHSGGVVSNSPFKDTPQNTMGNFGTNFEGFGRGDPKNRQVQSQNFGPEHERGLLITNLLSFVTHNMLFNLFSLYGNIEKID